MHMPEDLNREPRHLSEYNSRQEGAPYKCFPTDPKFAYEVASKLPPSEIRKLIFQLNKLLDDPVMFPTRKPFLSSTRRSTRTDKKR